MINLVFSDLKQSLCFFGRVGNLTQEEVFEWSQTAAQTLIRDVSIGINDQEVATMIHRQCSKVRADRALALVLLPNHKERIDEVPLAFKEDDPHWLIGINRVPKHTLLFIWSRETALDLFREKDLPGCNPLRLLLFVLFVGVGIDHGIHALHEVHQMLRIDASIACLRIAWKQIA